MRYTHLSPKDTSKAVEAINLPRFSHGQVNWEDECRAKALKMVGDAGFEPTTSAV